MKVVDEIKERVSKADKPGSYRPYITLFNKVTGATKVFPALDAVSALSMPNSKWAKEPVAAAAKVVVAKPLSEAVVEKAPEPVANPDEAMPLPVAEEQPEERPARRGRRPAEY